MRIQVRRLVEPRFSRQPFAGIGPRLVGSRWTRPGRAVVYTASTTSLALLEVLVRVGAPPLPRYTVYAASFDERLVSDVDVAALPPSWRSSPGPAALQAIGTAWLDSRRTPVLRVPSAVVPEESNYLLDPAHPNFPAIEIGEPRPLDLDPRLMK